MSDNYQVRFECALRLLPPNPLKDYGLQRYLDEAKGALVESGLIPEAALTWLPDVSVYFQWLNR